MSGKLILSQRYGFQMLILLYSDTNYVLGGFQAEFSVTDCPRNCSSHGDCVQTCGDGDCRHVCVCQSRWGGPDCSRELCPDGCGGVRARGLCDGSRCQCRRPFSGMSCSLQPDDPIGNRWVRIGTSGKSGGADAVDVIVGSLEIIKEETGLKI